MTDAPLEVMGRTGVMRTRILVQRVRSHPFLAGTALLVLTAALIAGIVQPWLGAAAAEEITAQQLRSGEKSGFLSRAVDRPAAPFTLTDQNGKAVSLEDFRGKWVVVDWVYVNCMTACVTLTSNMKALQVGLGEKMGSQVQLVSITFDPERDSVGVMKAHAQQVNGDVSGWSWLTGDRQQTDAVAEAYGVAYRSSEPVMGVAMFDHTVLAVVIDPEGRERYRYMGVGWSQELLEILDAELAAR